MKRKYEEEIGQRKRTLLVIESNEMNREILCDLLEDEYHILEAEDGLTGLEILDKNSAQIDLVLLNVYMPEMNGFEFLERKQADSRFDAIPVMMMTSSNTVEDEIHCLELGASDFITKPFNIEVVKNRMRSVIRLRQSSAVLGKLEIDSLTGLYSREIFYLNVENILHANPDAHYDIVCSDIENFRAMNEHYGQARCDRVLRALAADLTKKLPGLIIGGRIGPDIFAFLLSHQEEDWTKILDPKNLNQREVKFEVKYGVFADVDRGLPATALCDRATLALARCKKKFNAYVSWYDEAMRKLQMQEHEIVETMQASLENREFQVYYQPKHDLRADRTGGAEALVRWVHPEMGFISPGAFIPLFERNGFVTQLDFYIWEEVCRELQRCALKGIPLVPVSINVSRLDFEVPNLADQIAALVDSYGIDHHLLHIEVTESFYADNPDVIAATLSSLHEKGFIIELDDFGAGYSSLTSLNTLTLDVMKLDMSLIRHASAINDYSILRFAMLLADGMRMKTVAEGVETEDEVVALKVLGCDYIQGYYYSKPLPAPEFEKYLAAHAGVENA